MAEILTISPHSLSLATQFLSQNVVIGVPTETVYGLAGNAWSVSAIAKIFSTKNRPTFDPLIVHIPIKWKDLDLLQGLGIIRLNELNEQRIKEISALIHAFWPGPLTLILPKGPRIPDLVTSGLDCVGLRLPSHPGFQSLLNHLDFPLAAPSANRFGKISPTRAIHVQEELGSVIPLILDGGPCQIGIESTVLDCTQKEGYLVLRPGGQSIESIESLLKCDLSLSENSQIKIHSKKSPGHLLSHYAPQKPLFLLKKRLIDFDQEDHFLFMDWMIKQKGKWAFAPLMPLTDLLMENKSLFTQLITTQAYSTKGDLGEIAQNLFSTLRELDASDAQFLISESMVRTDGLAPAIQDRLARASTQILDLKGGAPR